MAAQGPSYFGAVATQKKVKLIRLRGGGGVFCICDMYAGTNYFTILKSCFPLVTQGFVALESFSE